MATPDEFRQLALSFPGAEEGSHMNHPDFRVGGRIFATLDSSGPGWGMVALTPEEQEDFIHTEPRAFSPAAGAWGRRGSTLVQLELVSREALAAAMAAAWRKRAGK